MARESSTGQMLVSDSQLMDSLFQRALYDTDPDIRSEAAEAFTNFASLVKAPMAQHAVILDALTELATSPHTRPEVVAKALQDQTLHRENRKAMVDRKALMTALATIGSSKDTPNTAKEDACSALLNLTKENDNLPSLATEQILHVLILNSTVDTAGPTTVSGYATKALLNLAKRPENRRLMAGQPRLLQNLIQRTASTVDNHMKVELKGTILTLAAEL